MHTCQRFLTTVCLVAAIGAAEPLPDPGSGSGLVVVVGQDDLEQTSKLAASGRFLVHQLVPAARVDALRSAALNQGIHGAVVIDALPTAGPLPHPSRFADLVMADLAAPGCPARAELERIANVGAILHLRVAGTWQAKPRPPEAGIAAWTHKWYDATGNGVSADAKVGPPETVQWQAGPAFSSSGLHVAVDSGAFVATDDSTLMVRSSGSGLPRWRSQATIHYNDEFLIDGDRILARGDPSTGHGGKIWGRSECGALIAYDLAGGATTALTEAPVMPLNQWRLPTHGHGFPSTVVAGNSLVASAGADLAVLERVSGKRRWAVTLPDGLWFSPRVLDDAVIAVECPVGEKAVYRGRVDSAYQVRAVHAYGLADGKLRWKTAFVVPDPTQPVPIDPKTGKPATNPSRASLKPLTCAAGTVFLFTSSYQCVANDASISAIDAKDGTLRWKSYTPEGGREKLNWSRTDSSGNIFYRDDRLYFVAGFGMVNGYGAGPVAIFDPATGNRLSITSAQGQGYGACGMSRATVNWFIKSAQTWNDKELKQVERPAARGPCGSGGFPAQGMFYVQPSVCDCREQSRGFLGMGSEPPLAITDSDRLSTGSGTAGSQRPTAGDWVSFLGNPQRTASTTAALPTTLTAGWSQAAAPKPIAGLLTDDRRRDEYWVGSVTAPVAAAGLVVVGCPDARSVVALDAATGVRRWASPLPGSIDTPPTIADGLCVAGCQDGSIVALSLDDGRLVWRFDAAPGRRLAMLNGRLTSAFPAPGSVLVVDGKVHVNAGFHTYLGGIAFWTLDLASGRPLAQRRLSGQADPTVTSLSNDMLCQAKDGSLWIGQSLRLMPDLTLASGIRYPKSEQISQVAQVAFTRRSAIVSFTNGGRGGSTHDWTGKIGVPRAPQLHAWRQAVDGDTVVSLSDGGAVTCINLAFDPKPAVAWKNFNTTEAWKIPAKDLPAMESPTSLIRAGGRTIIAGGNYAGTAGVVTVLSAEGKVESSFALPARVVANGLAVAGGRLVATCVDGTVATFAGP